MSKSALVVGATGLVGTALVKELLACPQYRQVTLLLRTPMELQHPKLVQQTVNFDKLDVHVECDDAFCCLGTTIKKAGSQAAFRKVDYTYPLETARLARSAGAARYLIVTSMGADPKSSVFYSRVKGEVEEALKGMGFPELHIFRPSLLLGERKEKRMAESIASVLSKGITWAMVGFLRQYRPIQAAVVAKAMCTVATQANGPGVRIYPSDRIAAIAEA